MEINTKKVEKRKTFWYNLGSISASPKTLSTISAHYERHIPKKPRFPPPKLRFGEETLVPSNKPKQRPPNGNSIRYLIVIREIE